MNTRVVHLVDETLTHPVLQSQTLAVIARLQEAGIVVDLLVANGTTRGLEEETARRFLGPSARVVSLSRRHPGSSSLAKARRLLARGLARQRAIRFVEQHRSAGSALVIHARGSAMHLGAQLRKRFADTRLIVDLRGDSAAEARANWPGPEGDRRARLVDRAESLAIERCDHAIAVSQALRVTLQKRLTLRRPVAVIPCVADERRFCLVARARETARRGLGLRNEPLLAYAGSIGQWHEFEATLDTFAKVAEKDGNARFLIASRAEGEVQRLVAERPRLLERLMIRSGTGDEVASWLNAADVGLLLRARHPLNAAASPVKFSEYVLSGLRVVLSSGIGDLEDWVGRLQLGRCVEGADSDSAATACLALVAEADRQEDRTARVERALPHFSLSSRLPEWISLYQSLLAAQLPEGE